MKTSENLDLLATALAAAQGEIGNASKESEGYGYVYADLATVLDIGRPILSKHGLSVVQLPHNQDGGIALSTRLMHSSGQWIEDTLVMPAEKSKNLSLAQDIGKIITYCRRYSYSALVGIAQEDKDAAKTGETEVVSMPQKKIDYTAQAELLREAAGYGAEALAETWHGLNKDMQKDLTGLKDQLKKDLV